LGVEALPIQCDVREDSQVEAMVQRVIDKWGRIDILVNNAGALWWKKMVDTPMKR
jgi:citronellol/citronellal dehydrogenase